jgi:hypothetical protein
MTAHLAKSVNATGAPVITKWCSLTPDFGDTIVFDRAFSDCGNCEEAIDAATPRLAPGVRVVKVKK